MLHFPLLLRHSNSWRSGRKERPYKPLKVGYVLLLCNSRSLNFNIPEKQEIGIFNSLQKVKYFGFLNGTIHYVTVHGVV